jgi:hypothetical protein
MYGCFGFYFGTGTIGKLENVEKKSTDEGINTVTYAVIFLFAATISTMLYAIHATPQTTNYRTTDTHNS